MAGKRKVSVASKPREERRSQGQTKVDPRRITEALGGFSVDNLLKIGNAITRLINRKLNAQAKEQGISSRELAGMHKRAAERTADPWAEFDGITFVPTARATRRKRGAA